MVSEYGLKFDGSHASESFLYAVVVGPLKSRNDSDLQFVTAVPTGSVEDVLLRDREK